MDEEKLIDEKLINTIIIRLLIGLILLLIWFNVTWNDKIINGENIIIDDSSYKCKMTNTLKENKK